MDLLNVSGVFSGQVRVQNAVLAFITPDVVHYSGCQRLSIRARRSDRVLLMKQKAPTSNDLRSKAEEALKSVDESSIEFSGEDMRQLIHELRVYQVELEIQNEELRRVQNDLEISRSRYADLYDFSPVGYLTFDQQGLIVEANLTAANQLSTERAILLKKPFFLYILEGDRDIFRLHLAQVFKTRERQTCEVKLNQRKSEGVFARLDSLLIEGASGDGVVRTSVIDISCSRHAEEVLNRARGELEDRVSERTTELSTANEQLRRGMEERERGEEILRRRVDFDGIMTQVLGQFATCALHDIDRSVVNGLESIALFMGADHAHIIIIPPDRTSWSVTHEWCAPHVAPVVHKYQRVPMGTMPWGENRILAGEIVRINSPDYYPPEALPERLYHEKEGAASVLILPIRNVTGQIAGCIGAETHARSIVWSDDDVLRLGMIGDTIASLLERKRMDQALAESRAQLVAVVDSTNDLIWSVDPVNFGVLAWNRALENYFLKNREIELRVGMPPEQLVPPEFVTTWKEFYSRALREGSFTTEYCIASGTLVLLISFNLLKRDGDVFGISVFGKDITERKKMEDVLKRSEEKCRALVETSSDWVWMVDANVNYTYADPKIKTILGYEPEEVIGRTPFQLMPEKEAQRVQTIFTQIAAERRPFSNLININLHRDGRQVILETSGVPLFGPDGEFIGYQGMDRDITERKHAEEILRESEEKFRQLAESIREVFWIQEQSSLLYISPACEQIFGLSSRSLIKDPDLLIDIVHPEDRERVFNTKPAGFANQESVIEYRVIRPDGSIRWIYSRSFPVRLGEDHVRIVGIAEDITERRCAEDALRHREQELMVLTGRLISTQEEELRRLSRELHDDLTQRLAVLAMDAGMIEKQLRPAEYSGCRRKQGFENKTDRGLRTCP